MKLFLFLGTAKGIKRVKIYDEWKGPNNIIYEGTYGEFSTKIDEMNLRDTHVMSWAVEDDMVIIGLDKII